MHTLRSLIALVIMTGLWVIQAGAQKAALSTVTNFHVGGGVCSFDVYATRTSTGTILVGQSNLIVNTNRAALSPIGLTITNINPAFTGAANHSEDYDPMRVDTITGPANAGKVAVTIVFTGNSSGAGVPLANLAAPGTRICTITMPVINPSLTPNLRWDEVNSAITDARSQYVANLFAGSDSSTLGTTEVPEAVPKVFVLYQNYPNPFNPSTEIKFSVETQGRATLEIYNILGQRLTILFDGVAEPGRYYKVKFDAKNLASGMYIYRFHNGTRSQIRKMLLLK